MTDLIDWLREQIAEDYQWAGDIGSVYPEPYDPGAPAHHMELLAHCEAHTALLDSYAEHIALPERTPYVKGRRDKAIYDLRLLALAYQHRPGYLNEWRP